MGTRRRGREFALQALYLCDITKLNIDQTIQSVVRGAEPGEAIEDFATRLAKETSTHRDELDVLIKKYAKNWEMNRMAALDRNIIRLGAYELLFELDTPISVIIDEAVEIAKTFSTDESGKFVNGILDQIKNERGKNGAEKKD